MDPHLKVSRAVTKLAHSKPFWGSLAMTCGHQLTKDLPTAATDGKRVYWNPEFIDPLTEEETRGLLAHELSHIIFMHCMKHGKPYDDDKKMCNVAMDIVINQILLDDGFKLPEGGIEPEERFRGMTWKQVFNIIKDEPEYQEMAKELTLEDVLENSDLSEEEKAEIKQKVIRAAEEAKARGVGNLPGGIDGLIDEIRETKVDWRAYLISLFQNKYPEDYTFRRPNKKLMEATGIYMPSMEGVAVGAIGIAVDTSGSVSQSEMVDYLTEINEITREFQPETVYLFYCDYECAKVEEYHMGEEIDVLKTRGGGGTSFVPVFDHIEKEGIQIDQLIYFSDMEVHDNCFPNSAPAYDVLWLSTRKDYPVPFGDVVRIHNDQH